MLVDPSKSPIWMVSDMATIKNIGKTNITIAGKKLLPGGELEVHGKISKSLQRLAEVGALDITGTDIEPDEDNSLVVDMVKNPKTEVVVEKTDDQVSSENDQKIIDLMKNLPAESMMADGRPEVRAVNEKLKEQGLNNISAEDRDRLWAQVSKED